MLHAREDYNGRIVDNEEKIMEHEPVFLLRAQDLTAADVVRYWADMNEKEGGDPKLTQMARDHAMLMDDWPYKKLADL